MADWSHIQGVTNLSSGSTASTTVSAVSSGDIICGTVFFADGITLTSVTDNQSNIYHIVPQAGDGGSHAVAGFFTPSPITNAPTSITTTLSASSGFLWSTVDEFAPPTGFTTGSIDGQQVLLNSPATVMSSFQTIHSDTLVYVGAFNSGSQTTGAGFNAGAGSGTAVTSEWAIQSAASTSVTPAWGSNTGSVWGMAFGVKPAAQNTWELRQRQMQRSATTASVGTTSFPKACSSVGSLIMGTIAVDSASTLSSITDDKSNSYVVSNTGSFGRMQFWSNGLISNQPTSITVNCASVNTTVFMLANEFLPPPTTTSVAIDGTPTNTTASLTTPTVTTTQSGDLAYTMGDNGGLTTGISGGYSISNGNQFTWSDAYFIQRISGNISATWVAGAGSTDVSLIAYSAVVPATVSLVGATRVIVM